MVLISRFVHLIFGGALYGVAPLTATDSNS